MTGHSTATVWKQRAVNPGTELSSLYAARTPAQGMVPLTFRVGLPSSTNLLLDNALQSGNHSSCVKRYQVWPEVKEIRGCLVKSEIFGLIQSPIPVHTDITVLTQYSIEIL